MERDGWLRVEVRHLAALRAVAREGSFGAAALSLGYTQSAVSQQIATLERAVGETLIDRPGGPRKVALTEAGEVLLRHAERIVAGMEAAWADLNALSLGAAGNLRVGTYQSVGTRILPALVRRLMAERPGMEVLLTESASDRELLDQLERGETDLSFTVLPLDDGPFEAVELLRDPYVIVAAADSEMARAGRPPSLEDLSAVPVIGSRHCLAGARLEKHLADRGLPLNIVFRSDDNGTMQGLAGTGMAVAITALLAVDPADPNTVALRPAADLPSRRIGLAWHRDRSLSSSARAFIDAAVSLCAEMQPEMDAAPTLP
ncbi:MAG: LysR family transcriptional regulator [Thermoleophilia bacterium]